MIPESKRKRNSPPRGGREPLAAVPVLTLALLALFGSQLIGVQHNHEGDPGYHLDCSICVKQGADPDLPPANASPAEVRHLAGESIASARAAASAIPLSANPRAPPLS